MHYFMKYNLVYSTSQYITGMYFAYATSITEKNLAYAMSIIYKIVNHISIKYKKYHVTFS